MDYKHNKEIVPFAKTLRKNMTKEEKHLWYDYLRRYPVRFIRQKIIGKYIVDFYCARAKLVVELDGSQHYEPEAKRKDIHRTQYLNSQGIEVLRFSNLEVLRQFENVCSFIHFTVQHRTNSFSRGEAVERKRD